MPTLPSEIVGMRYYPGAWDRIRYLKSGHEVELRREPQNPYDSNAVAVYVGEKVGHIPRGDAKVVAAAMDAGYGVVAHIEGSSPLLTIMWDEARS